MNNKQLLKTLVLSLILLVTFNKLTQATINITNFPFAAKEDSVFKPVKFQIIDVYVNAIVYGKTAGFDQVVADDAEFDIKRGGAVHTLSKTQIMASLKGSDYDKRGCNYIKTVLMNYDEKTVVKIEMKYNDYTRTDIVTAERSGKGWKITSVQVSFILPHEFADNIATRNIIQIPFTNA